MRWCLTYLINLIWSEGQFRQTRWTVLPSPRIRDRSGPGCGFVGAGPWNRVAGDHVVVAGGHNNSDASSVEILLLDKLEWTEGETLNRGNPLCGNFEYFSGGPPLPLPLHEPSTVPYKVGIEGATLYVLKAEGESCRTRSFSLAAGCIAMKELEWR